MTDDCFIRFSFIHDGRSRDFHDLVSRLIVCLFFGRDFVAFQLIMNRSLAQLSRRFIGELIV